MASHGYPSFYRIHKRGGGVGFHYTSMSFIDIILITSLPPLQLSEDLNIKGVSEIDFTKFKSVLTYYNSCLLYTLDKTCTSKK